MSEPSDVPAEAPAEKIDQHQNLTDSNKSTIPPNVIWGFVIVALLGVMLMMSVRGGLFNPAPKSEANQLEAELDARRSELNRMRIEAGLSPISSNAEPVDDIAKRLKADADTLVSLSARFQEMLAEKDTELTARSAELIRSEKTRAALTAESARIQSELQRALVSASDVELLRRDLAAMRSQRDALAEQLKAQGERPSSADLQTLQSRLDEVLALNASLQARIDELTRSKLFAKSENELLPAAVELFRTLRELENKTDSEVATAYSKIGLELGASVLHTLNFSTGSSGLAPADEEAIRQLVSQLPDGDLLLVVGYASETGNVDDNRLLSSDRATAVAELYSSVKRPGQNVQAVYLGQTDRFSSRIPERNQLCEIWRIRKKIE
ncbi:MAG: hypothetical protein EAZ42_11260 [Verrucomicrobia bacterium]|nr:MAG: hypothetical protein EAZ42_11260 [Verrucomicrobiota bacterium]